MGRVRVRFAPSPTGSLHIGGARTALFNWLFARHWGGRFILRIEDTDVQRSTEASFTQILSSLKWLGLDWDEGPGIGGSAGPYLQSLRLDFYRQAAEALLERGAAYYCYCAPAELEAQRAAAREKGEDSRYDGRCCHLSSSEAASLQAKGIKPAIRIKVPRTGRTLVQDQIRGEVSFENELLDDFVIMKSNGLPTYNFAVVVDDHQMDITHVIRAEEHLSNTPKQLHVYSALHLKSPVFAHVPMILAPDRSKLSKRHGATSVEEFRDQGFLPEAIINYLALLGWAPEGGTVEILPLQRMIRQFDLNQVGKTASIYDVKKMAWINGYYLKEADLDKVTEMVIPFMERAGIITAGEGRQQYAQVKGAVDLVRGRARTLAEVADGLKYFFLPVGSYEEKGIAKYFLTGSAADLLGEARDRLAGLAEFNEKNTEAVYRNLSDDMGVPAGALIHPTRLALTGGTASPGLFEVMVLLGKDKTMERLQAASEFIKNLKAASGQGNS